jgi:ribosomal protein S13
LNYVVEEWMKDNSIAIERGIKGEIAEDFISGLKKLFEDHYIDVPDEKYNVLEDQASKIEELEKKLNEQVNKNVEQNQAMGSLKKTRHH